MDFISILPFYTRYVLYFCLVLVCVCFMVVSGLLGNLLYDWGSILVFRAFSGGFDRVLGVLGFLLPPCAFYGLPIFVCGRAKGWDGDAGDVRFSERFLPLGLWGRVHVFYC